MDAILVIFLFALGACVGSFLNVVIWRLPRGESIVFPGSHCPSCGRAIRWYDNIPLLSWLVLKGRCRACKARISPRYLVVEAITAVLVCGLYVSLFVLRVREGAGEFFQSVPMFLAHASLFCGLLASALVDIESWIVPLEVCWFVSAVGLACAAISPPAPQFLPPISPAAGAMSLGAALGLVIALVLLHYGLLQRSFLDADDKPTVGAADRAEPKPDKKRGKKQKKQKKKSKDRSRRAEAQPPAIAITRAHGVNPRREILREVAFLAPALVLAAAAGLLVTGVDGAREAWDWLTNPGSNGAAIHLNGLLAALFGYLIGGLWIWGFRILGTLAFGKEAMGLGDVHILAAVGAVCGWIVPSMAFFLAAFLALAWAVTIYVLRRQRELPYGPWLAGGALVAVLFYDRLVDFLRPYAVVFGGSGEAFGAGQGLP